MNTKPQRLAFLKETRELIEDYGGISIESKYDWREEFLFKGKNGTFTMILPSENDQKLYFTIYGRFDFFNKLTGKCNTKYNFINSEPDQENYIGLIVDALNEN